MAMRRSRRLIVWVVEQTVSSRRVVYPGWTMKGIEYVVDDEGRRRAVVIDLGVHGELWEDFYDVVVALERAEEPRESLDEVKARLSRPGG